jgi:ubiquinol-cytochrome c reductase cytochrome c subunit
MNVVAISSSAILAALLCASTAIAAQAPPPGDAERGKAAFLRVGCYTCHGFEGQGVPGRKLAPNPLPYPAFSNFVRTSQGEMPTFTDKVLSDQDLADIHAYLRSKPASPNPSTILLLQEAGR